MASSELTFAIGQYVAGTALDTAPPQALDDARKCLVDWFAVCIGAARQPEARALRAALAGKGRAGATLLGGGCAAPADAALFNGALSHVLDFDDTHVPSILHGSGPLWAALLAAGETAGIGERRLLEAFVAGFQVGARLGGNGRGEGLTRQGWHVTPVVGRIAAAAALARARGLSAGTAAHALALAASQAGGLTASFGSMAKPLNAGRAASDAVLAAELAAHGFEGPLGILDGEGGLLPTLLQDPGAAFGLDLDALRALPWEVSQNSFKPYASCQLTHAAIDAARELAGHGPADRVQCLRAHVHPLAIKVAGRETAATPNEAKFSLRFCIALALAGHACGMDDFSPQRLADVSLHALAARVELHVQPGGTRRSARLQRIDRDGVAHEADVDSAFGNPDNPMGWDDLRAKFRALASHWPASDAARLLDCLEGFGAPGSLTAAMALVQRNPA